MAQSYLNITLMQPITIRRVETKKDLDRFIRFNYQLYKDSPYAVPDLYSDVRDTLTDKNPAAEFCDSICFLALRGKEVVGRIAGIINRRANERWGLKAVRFGWIDFVDDPAVSQALLKAVEGWGRAHGMDTIQGPLGFTDMDAEGMLVEGFEELSTMATIYNYPYYRTHLEQLGYEKATGWIEMLMRIPTPEEGVPERLTRVAKIVMEKHKLHIVKYSSVRQMAKDYGQEVFSVINEGFKPLFGYSEMTPRQIDQYVKTYLPLLDPKLISLVADEQGHLVGVGISMPSMSRALQKAQGFLFPTGWWHLLKALKWKHADTLDLLLVAVLPEWQNKGVNAVFFHDLLPLYISGGYRWVETNIELEDNQKVQQQWIYFERRQHKRRWCFRKKL